MAAFAWLARPGSATAGSKAVHAERNALRVAVRRWSRAAAMTCACVWFASAAAAQMAVKTPASDAVAQEAIGQLRSPYCPGLMLEVCPSGQAEALRDSIRMLAADGNSANELIEWMLARHGEEWRAVPKRSGMGLWAWIVPPLVLLLGLGAVVAKLRGMRRPAEWPAREIATGDLTHRERDELAAALRDWEESPEGRT